ncbi:ABC transporter permease [Verminephrobacter aporrectodeae]|uniref:ABC transporter permease n=2 Tax=Verminephrobacter TaxID=364316 RepID=A0ABT3KN15_9BURK|nr:ABC transporter permease [Verminephrobacter aporrectodeae]MCW5254870.1 ABC transporter permease [Verminephrobacter aporrectodeae subsp. tuberculatae]MCW5319711.1 ABC transporter permease [Verminephrobacter aporrectodeae subsp. tuberculatae]MCW8164960.1 ABC transporter permease [Verminephrobacter aporrectodeae subsp. tuberculatae]MCW8167908.1 ABC transporter permease [Verminephrobacter aporrectodeae subsp. tuberculatae]MCW8174756.1 ABC transporter permease [Verminephrobacter aporrectodeae su
MRPPRMLRQLMQRRSVLFSALLLLAIAVLAVGAPVLAGADPNEMAVLQRLQAPSAEHLLGTDELGRDVYARVVHGARHSLAIAALTALGAVLAGSALGLLAGFLRRLDAPLMRVVDAMLSFPDILLAIALVAVLGPSPRNTVLALVLVYTPRVARVVRASTLVLRELLFVEAVRALGVRSTRILWRHILPNLTSPILVQLSFIFACALLAEAGLSFLGVGVPPDIPTWGSMVAGSQQYAHQAFWVVLFPGLAIIFSALALQLLGDGVRDLLDPRLQKAA